MFRIGLLKMFRPIFAVFALVAVATAQPSAPPSFINKCSLSAPNLEQCFVKNGNLAIEELHYGVENLDIPSLEGFDLGDIFFSLGSDLSFLLEDGKAYPKGVKLDGARLKFGSQKNLKELQLSFFAADVNWQAKYRALGFVGNHKVNEKGFTQINFGELRGNYTVQFKRKEVAGVSYLKAHNYQGAIEYEKFEFVPKDVTAVGEALKQENFQQLEQAVIDKLVDISFEHVTFVFNQVLLEIPEKELFLP